MSTSLFDYIYTAWAKNEATINWDKGHEAIEEAYETPSSSPLPAEEVAAFYGQTRGRAHKALDRIKSVWEGKGHLDDHDIDYREMGDLTVLLIDGEAVSVGLLDVGGHSALEAAGFYR